MRQFEEMPLDPDVVAELDAIDATLEGLAVDPIHAELAELALLLSSEREQPEEDFIRQLDARAARRFAPTQAAARPAGRAARRRRLSRPSLQAVGALAAAGFAAVTAGVVVSTGALSNNSSKNGSGANVALDSGQRSGSGANHGLASGRTAEHPSVPPSSPPARKTTMGTTTISGGNGTFSGSAGKAYSLTATNTLAPNTPAPSPSTSTAKRVIQSAQLQLNTPNAHIDQVAQEVFNVVTLENGTVQNSHVTQAAGGSDGGSYASFSLSIPTASLQETLNRMSDLRYATVSSRTDGTQNVSNQYSTDQRHIGDDKALRTALLKELQNAYTQTAIDSIEAQLKLAENQLTSDERALGGLQHQISYSSLNVQVNAGPIFPIVAKAKTTSNSFTIGKAAHDSVRVLVVMIGILLIGLVALVPLGVLALVVALILMWVRRRGREQALDAS